MLRAAVLAFLIALVAGCGSGASSGDADPAAVVPADAMLYSEATVRPEGDLREDALAAAAKVLRTDDPSGRIRELVDRALDHHGDLDYATDVRPWLGDRVGVWLDGARRGAVVVGTTDPEAALAAFHKGGSEHVYRGVSYEVDADGIATGVVDDFLVAGPEPAFKRTVDASDGDSLAEANRYRDGVDRLSDDRLGHFYVDLRRAFEAARQSDPDDEQLPELEGLLPFDRLRPLVGSFSADGDRLAVDVPIDGDMAGALGSFGGAAGSTPLVRELPGDSWAAFGAADYGRSLAAMLDRYAGLFGGAAREQLRRQYGIDLDEDVLSWIGDVAFFVRGESVDRLDGGVVIQVTDSEKAATGFGKLVGLLQTQGLSAQPISVDGAETAFAVRRRGAAKPVVVARSDERVVVVYGEDAAAEAFSPGSELGDSELYGRAKDLLDVDPGLLVSMPAVVRLIDATGETDADFEKARPYLDAYDVIAAGYGDGRVRLAAGLR